MKNKVLLTGATGYIGSNLAKKLIANGAEVHSIYINDIFSRTLDKSSGAAFHLHDGTTENMINIVKEVKPDFVFHLASLFLAQHTPNDISTLVKSNITFSTQLVEAMIQNKVHKLVNTGTSWQNFENKDYDPVCLYAATKQAFEDILKYYTAVSPLKVITLKLFDTYGPGDPRPKLMPKLHEATTTGTTLNMSPGKQLLDFVYIDDVINAFIMASERLNKNKASYETFAVTSRKPRTLKEIVSIYEKVSGSKIDAHWGTRQYRLREVMVPWNKGKLLPGWKPKVSLEEGIKRCEKL
jgi:nucleoside-diphosphate-sugar epimerase